MDLDNLMQDWFSEYGLTDFEMRLAERKDAMEKCASLSCDGNGVAFLREDLAERVLYEYFDVDELKLLVDFYFSCGKPFPLIMGGAPLIGFGKGKAAKDDDERHYARVIRNIGGVAEVNRSLFLDEKGGPFHNILYAFVQGYNDLTGQKIRLDLESFPKDVREEGWRLFTDTKDLDSKILRELLYTEDSGVSERARGQREADRARDEKERNFTRVRNHEKAVIRSVGREKDALVDRCLRAYPFLGYYYELPDSVQPAFLNVLKRVYMVKAVENGLPLGMVFIGLDNELYRTMDVHGNGRIKIEGDYNKYLIKLAAMDATGLHPDNEECKELVDGLQEKLMTGLYEPRRGPVFSYNGVFEDFVKIRGIIPLLYLGAGALRKRIRDGRLKGVKIAQGKYIAEPRAGYWLVNPDSVGKLKERYGLLEFRKPRVLRLNGMNGLSLMREGGSYHIVRGDGLSLDGVHFRGRVRGYIQENMNGYKTITLGRNEMLAVPPEIVEGIRRGL